MKKIFTFLVASLLIINLSFSQTILFTDSFETYTTGGFLVQQANAGGWWTTWSNQINGGAEDAKISELQAHSPIKSVLVDNAADDLILKLGNKTSGKFNVSFWYYIPTGFGGYFNMQHYQAPGIQWATEVYFGNDGNGSIDAQGITTLFTHPLDTWTFIETIVDIDLDSAWFYVDGVKIVQWKFSTKADGTAGAAQLGGIDFYGGAISGQTPTYYFDDVAFTQLAQPLDPPTINLSTTNITTDGLAPESFTITNAGQEDMTFDAYTTYPYDVNNVTTTATLTELTHVQGGSGVANGLGWLADQVGARVANKFRPQDINPAIGQEISSVFVGFNDVPTNTSLLVYDRGSYITPGTGTLLQTIPFTVSTIGEIVNVPLTSPIYIDGKDLWIGYICDALTGTYPIGMDAGPIVPGVNWSSIGPGWSEIGPTFTNLVISANLQGNPVKQWLTITPTSGTILASQLQQIDLSFNIVGIPDGTYHSVVVVGSNDPANEYSNVDVYLTVVTNIANPDLNIGIMTFPNPATQNVNVKSNQSIDYINVYDINGKLMNKVNFNTTNGTVDVSKYAKGNYVLEIISGSNIVKRNIVVK